MLPGEDGLSLARCLSTTTRIPIIMLSARDADVDRIVGLEVGDDYLAKPFNPRDLLARIRARLRRHEEVPAKEGARNVYVFGAFRFDPTGYRLTRDGVDLDLTNAEFTPLWVFVENPNQMLSRDRLIDLIKGYDRSPCDRSIDVRVTRLRRKSAYPNLQRTARKSSARVEPADVPWSVCEAP